MFEEVTKQEGGQRAVRRGAWLAASTVFQVLFVLAIIVIGDRIRAAVTGNDPVVDVKFIRPAAPPPPPPPPPPPRRTPPKPKAEVPKKVLPPTAMIQPKEVAPEMKPPDPNEPPEEEAGPDEGVEGGVIGGVVGGQQGGIEDAPAYATAGFKKPAEAQRGCAANSVRVPADLKGFISGPITVKFAINRSGQPTFFQVMTPIPDKRIGDAIWQGITSCQWVPGSDPQGRPTSIWVIMPIRFTSG